jgi:hypothetical protein
LSIKPKAAVRQNNLFEQSQKRHVYILCDTKHNSIDAMNTSDSDTNDPRSLVSDAVRFWEPRRILYNSALLAIVIIQFALHWTTGQEALNWSVGRTFFNLAVVANVFYCAAYIPDLLAQFSRFRPAWHRFRWGLLAVGILFGCSLAWDISLAIITHAHS